MIRRAWRLAGNGQLWLAALMAGAIVIATGDITPVEAASSGDVVNVRLGGAPNQTRLVIDLQASAKGELLSREEDQQRAVLGLSGIDVGAALSGQGQGLVKGWKLDTTAGMTRLRLDFSRNARIARRFLLPPADGISTYRYVIDVVAADAPAPQTVSAKTVADTAPIPPALRTEAADKPRTGKKIIVVDAGHGGHDPGARGASSWEKDVNLEAAKALKAKLEATGRYKVIMTRDSDVYVDKVARVRIARNANADLFISLHSDSGPNTATKGASIYTLSDSGTERAARNAMNRGDWALPTGATDKTVGRILIDLTQRATKNRSATFAELMLDNMDGTVPLLKGSHRQAGFVVLLAADVPAVLLEMGFITNAEDERRLNDSGDRNRMAGQLVKAIDQYFANDVRYASFGFVAR
ncbi:N-acetylmuramoyl-L-alanine amidase family protein [Asticcacaulis excentricus]|uniref:N-acetylmuramoyl-L-alanine amidase n=1 Tax=Asticcacaulis excentricus (strain ATCC 15261 / DSM 4724 / KCTC 12464 / NCIMB 9791 / VKM B-1370 / CB 48) TaxID=573065 RepID=E8RT10_ASTEC|nr:N-acetylmuramoyl-L-alanine amidase [Asticcacaulis excentricus]ADU14631.1 cell wall hydrolase/autolysin [Asticcacaulis excentricus CB 48]